MNDAALPTAVTSALYFVRTTTRVFCTFTNYCFSQSTPGLRRTVSPSKFAFYHQIAFFFFFFKLFTVSTLQSLNIRKHNNMCLAEFRQG